MQSDICTYAQSHDNRNFFFLHAFSARAPDHYFTHAADNRRHDFIIITISVLTHARLARTVLSNKVCFYVCAPYNNFPEVQHTMPGKVLIYCDFP